MFDALASFFRMFLILFGAGERGATIINNYAKLGEEMSESHVAEVRLKNATKLAKLKAANKA